MRLAESSIAGGMSRGARLSLGAIALVAIGSIGPWVEVAGEAKGGLDSDGVITLSIAAIAAAYLLFTPQPHWVALAVLAFLAGFVAVFDIFDISDSPELFGIAPGPGWGIWLTAVGAAALGLVAGTIVRTESPHAKLGLAGKAIVGIGALLAILFVISLFGGEEAVDVAPAELQEPRQIEP